MTDNTDQTSLAAPIKERTREGYLKAVNSAIRHSTSARTTDWEEPAIVTLEQIVGDLICREDLARSTKMAVRAALLWYIRSGQTPKNSDSDAALALLGGMTNPKGRRPENVRPKVISEQDLSKLLDEIYHRADRSEWALKTAVWIHAALASGARPIEWLDAEWADADQTTLKIRNAKVKLMAPAFLRGPGAEDHSMLENLDYWDNTEEAVTRTVPLSKESERSMVDTHLQYIQQAAPRSMSEESRRLEFAKYYAACRLVISRACKSIWGNKRAYSLYTMRGQFAANMAAAHGADSKAALLGHTAPDSPSAAYYGKWNQAHARFKAAGALRETSMPVQAPTSFEAGPSEGGSAE